MEYDDEAELTQYIWNHYIHLMSAFEQRVGLAIFAQAKGTIGTRDMQLFIEKRHGLIGDNEVEGALAAGPEAFRRRVSRRVLTERAGDIFVNRCPRCDRVVRTPKARQCLWCGYDWHND